MTRANPRMERLGDELRHVIAPLVSNAQAAREMRHG